MPTGPFQPNFRTLDLNLLRVFDEVMAERSLTRAARNLSLTQPAVSNALRRLREALGDELVRRGGAGIEPTVRALALWPSVRDALRSLQASLAPGTFDPSSATTTFVLAMADATAATLVPGLLQIAEADAPGVSLRVVPLTTRDPRALLDAAAADLAVGYFPAALADMTAREQAQPSPSHPTEPPSPPGSHPGHYPEQPPSQQSTQHPHQPATPHTTPYTSSTHPEPTTSPDTTPPPQSPEPSPYPSPTHQKPSHSRCS